MATSKWYQHQIRVRYQETDQMGIVYHTNYVNWMEWGRTELIREAGLPYQEVENVGLMLPIVHLQVDFKGSAKYDDIVSINTRIKEATPLRLSFEYEIKTGEALLIRGESEHVWLNRTFKPTRVDKCHPELFALIRQITSELE